MPGQLLGKHDTDAPNTHKYKRLHNLTTLRSSNNSPNRMHHHTPRTYFCRGISANWSRYPSPASIKECATSNSCLRSVVRKLWSTVHFSVRHVEQVKWGEGGVLVSKWQWCKPSAAYSHLGVLVKNGNGVSLALPFSPSRGASKLGMYWEGSTGIFGLREELPYTLVRLYILVKVARHIVFSSGHTPLFKTFRIH